MAFDKPHEIYKRRFSRNVGVGLALVCFVALVFGLTVVKMIRGQDMRAYDHGLRPNLIAPQAPDAPDAPKVQP